MLKQKGKGMVNWFGFKNVVIVEDEDEMVFYGGDVIEQGRQKHFNWWELRGLERTQHPCSNIGRNCPHSRDEVYQKACGVVLPLVKRQPGHRSLATGDP